MTIKLGLGTAQFGLNYGLTNTRGKIPLNEVKGILSAAKKSGVQTIDTASAYGESESVLGQSLDDTHFRIITKLPGLKSKKIESSDIEGLKSSFQSSLNNLGQKTIYGVLVHQTEDVLPEGGEQIIKMMEQFKRDGTVQKIGVSVYTADQIDQILDQYKVDIIQLPFHVLDQRLLKSGHLAKLHGKGIEIHARSIFFQGVLLTPPDQLDPFFNPIQPQLKLYHEFMKDQGLKPLQGALGFIKNQTFIDTALVGVSSEKEFGEISNEFNHSVSLSTNFEQFSCHQEDILNPSKWKLTEKVSR